MVKRMLIDATHPEETRVVVVNGTRLEELDVETITKRQLKGNIYLAKVVRVEPSLQAAFVEYGGNRHGFLAFSEIHPDYFQIPVADRQALLAAQRADVREMSAASDDHVPHPESENGGDANAEAGGENGEAPAPAPETLGGDDPTDQELERRRARLLRNYKIQEVIKRRQIMLVQVVKEERGNKGAALTTYLSLAGRYCVLMPNTARGGGVSRKITSVADRKRLKAIASEMEVPEGMAVIVRTAGSERSKTEIRRDYEYLMRMWDSVRELTLSSSAPALVYEEASLIKRSIRDLYARDIDEVLVDGDEGYRLAKDYMRMLTPSHAKKVQPYKDPIMPMFHRYQVESQLDAMHSPVVQLRSGGYIVISQTEALVAIDVNSGRSTKERHIEETAVKTNLEAADEVARQLRLRDLAGLIVIDFIDMEENRNNHAVERRLKDALKNDRARIQVGRISAFGLLELSRQRLRPSLQETTFTPCPHCDGSGLVRSVESAAVHVLRAIEEEGIRRRSSEVTVTVATPVALYILNQKRDALAAIEDRYQFRVFMEGDDTLIPPALRMERVKGELRPEDYRPAAISMDTNLAPEPVEAEEDEDIEETEVEAAAEGGDAIGGREARGETGDIDADGRKRRRRRRRKRRPGELPGGDEQTAGNAEASAEGEGGSEDEGDEDEGGEGGEGQPEALTDEQNEERRRRRRGRRGGRRRRGRGREGEGEGEGEIEGEIPAVVVTGIVDGVMTRDAVADVFEAAEAAAEAAAAERNAVPAEAAAEEAPKRKRAPRKKADATPVAADAEAEVEKPKRKRAPRKKVEAVADEAATVAEAATEAAPVADIAAEPGVEAPAPASLFAPVVETPAPASLSAPVVEAPEPAPEPPPPAPVGPPRRGWWNKLVS
ncbi:MAG: ribonuclease E/G [Magnetospirillum sp.]|nr:ribonuclease E/G [Magnetospirillum sp.]